MKKLLAVILSINFVFSLFSITGAIPTTGLLLAEAGDQSESVEVRTGVAEDSLTIPMPSDHSEIVAEGDATVEASPIIFTQTPSHSAIQGEDSQEQTQQLLTQSTVASSSPEQKEGVKQMGELLLETTAENLPQEEALPDSLNLEPVYYPLSLPSSSFGQQWDGINFNTLTTNKSGFYYGTYNHATALAGGFYGSATAHEGVARPVLWSMMGEEANDGYITSLSKYVVESEVYNPTAFASSEYLGSPIQTFVSTTFLNGFSTLEKSDANMPPSTVVSNGYVYGTTTPYTVNDTTALSQKAYLPWFISLNTTGTLGHWSHDIYLDAAQTLNNSLKIDSNYSAGNWPGNIATLKNGTTVDWWSRNPASFAGYAMLSFQSNGHLDGVNVNIADGVRPVFKLNPQSVLYLSAIVTSSPNAGQIQSDANYAIGSGTTNYKVTLHNPALTLSNLQYNASNVTSSTALSVQPGSTMALTGAVGGGATKLVYKIVQNSGARNIINYGTGTATTINIVAKDFTNTNLANGEYAVYVWAQKDNATYSHEGSTPQYFTFVIDTTSPVIASTVPANGASNVLLSTNTLSITFDEAMLTTLPVTGSVTLNNGAVLSGGTWQGDNKTIQYTLSNINSSTSYSISVSGFKDVAGNTMIADNTRSFTTESVPMVSTMSATPNTFNTLGGQSTIDVQGTNLPSNTYIQVFNGATPTALTGTATGTSTSKTISFTFPANASFTTDKIYTVKVSFDGGTTWEATTAAVTVSKNSGTQADASSNQFTLPSTILTGTPFPITATGDRQDVIPTTVGETRYIPVSWSDTAGGGGSFSASAPYTATASVSSSGSCTFEITYAQQMWNGTGWVDTGLTDTKSQTTSVIPAPVLSSMTATPSSFNTLGGQSTIGVQGTNLPSNTYLQVFDGATPTTLTGTATGTSTSKTISFTFPANASFTTDKIYTVKVSFDGGTTWEATTATVTVSKNSGTQADASSNQFTLPSTILTGTPFPITATGDRQDVIPTTVGETRYIPASWSDTAGGGGSFSASAPYTATASISSSGSCTFEITYAQQIWNGTGWVDTGLTDTKSQTTSVVPAPVLSSMTATPSNFNKLGGTSTVEIGGSNLVNGMLITAFDGVMATTISQSTTGNGTNQSAMLTFPANTSITTDKVYTIKTSYDGGTTWDATSTATVTVAKNTSTQANLSNNQIQLPAGGIFTRNPFTITAVGDRQDATGIDVGETRFIPTSWYTSSGQNGTFPTTSPYNATVNLTNVGDEVFNVVYTHQQWDGTMWVATGMTDTKSSNGVVTQSAIITEVQSSSSTLPTQGGSIDIVVLGTNLFDGILVKAQSSTVTASPIQVTTTGSSINQAITMIFPANTSALADVVYTIYTSLDNGLTWDITPITTTIAKNTKVIADPSNNQIQLSVDYLHAGIPFVLTAVGDRQDAPGSTVGETKYIPTNWNEGSNISGSFSNKAPYTSTITIPTSGKFQLTIHYAQYAWDGSKWIATGEIFSLTSTVTIAIPANVQNNLITLPTTTIKSGSPFVITAVGDRQSDAPIYVGDQRYIPQSWHVNPSGTFMAPIYTATTSISNPGEYLFYVDYALQEWNGTKWVTNGETNTKSIPITVQSATSQSSGTARSAATGERANQLFFIGLACAAVSALLILFLQKRKKRLHD